MSRGAFYLERITLYLKTAAPQDLNTSHGASVPLTHPGNHLTSNLLSQQIKHQRPCDSQKAFLPLSVYYLPQ